ncbi:hypothetical protein TcasGA2_TC034997, partial [Tribolium castaneum]
KNEQCWYMKNDHQALRSVTNRAAVDDRTVSSHGHNPHRHSYNKTQPLTLIHRHYVLTVGSTLNRMSTAST